jgi:hypothetical protein
MSKEDSLTNTTPKSGRCRANQKRDRRSTIIAAQDGAQKYDGQVPSVLSTATGKPATPAGQLFGG